MARLPATDYGMGTSDQSRKLITGGVSPCLLRHSYEKAIGMYTKEEELR